MAKYYGMVQFTSLVVTLLMSLDVTYFNSFQLLYKNFVNNLTITLFLGLSRPAKRLSRWVPNSNLLDLENHLTFWGILGIYSVGLVVADRVYTASSDFVANPYPWAHFPEGWNGVTKSSTLNFLTANVLYISLPFFIYRGWPWKCPIYQNRALIILIGVNAVLLVGIGLATSHLGAVDVVSIAIPQVLLAFAIMLAATILVGLYSHALQWLFFTRKIKKTASATKPC